MPKMPKVNPLLKKLGVDIDVDITIKEKKAQLLIAAAIFIIAIGIAWSFIQGWSKITYNKAPTRSHTEKSMTPNEIEKK